MPRCGLCSNENRSTGNAVATLATWMMTLVIQRSEHRDTQAMHAKLDDLLRANEKAQTGLARIDSQEPEEIEEYRHQTYHD
jgi:low affinity Fe/Cu permease